MNADRGNHRERGGIGKFARQVFQASEVRHTAFQLSAAIVTAPFLVLGGNLTNPIDSFDDHDCSATGKVAARVGSGRTWTMRRAKYGSSSCGRSLKSA